MSLIAVTVEIGADKKIHKPDPDPAEAKPGDYLIFVVENLDDETHTVSIPPIAFKRKKDDSPILPIHLFAVDSAEIEPGGSGFVLLHIKEKGHFKSIKASTKKKKAKKKKAAAPKRFAYKYSVFASDLDTLDPEIGINN